MEQVKQTIVVELEKLKVRFEELQNNFKGQDTRIEQAIVATRIEELVWVLGLFSKVKDNHGTQRR